MNSKTANAMQTVGNRTFRDLFASQIQFEIPFFQRGYSWERRQWEQLFEDINDHILGELSHNVPSDEIEHFFGPIVVLEEAASPKSARHFLVVDGQQRITTVYLLLGIIYRKLETFQTKSSDAAKYRSQIAEWLINNSSPKNDYQKLKLFSIKGDRLPTYRALFGTESVPHAPEVNADFELYEPGENQVDAFVVYAERKLRLYFQDVPKLWQLATALIDCLKIVWIPLEEGKDDPQAIFESLNDKGLPLTASELLCSYLFRPLTEVKDFEELHNHQWLAAAREFKHRSDFEEYLRTLFSIGERKMVGTGRRVYIHFKNRNKDLDMELARKRLAEIQESARHFACISQPEKHIYPDAAVQRLLEHIACTGIESCAPFVLDLVRNLSRSAIPREMGLSLLEKCLTLLVRRKITEQPTTNYDTMFPRLFGLSISADEPVLAMQELFRKSGVWVSDSDFENALLTKALYRPRELEFTRMVLSEIDRAFLAGKDLPDYTTLGTIEHIIPPNLDQSWAKELGADVDHPKYESLVNSLGNLALSSRPAKKLVAQSSLDSKLKSLPENSGLAVDLQDVSGIWNLDSVQSRSLRLAQTAKLVWSWEAE